MTSDPKLSQPITSAHEKLLVALSHTIRDRKQPSDFLQTGQISPELQLRITSFVRAIYELPGGKDQLQKRATMIETLCGPESDYETARVVAVLSYQFEPEMRSRSQMAMHRLQGTTSQPMFLSILDDQWKDLQCMLTEGVLDLVDSTREAYDEWRAAISKVQQRAASLEVDGCWFLFYVHEGCDGRQSDRTVNAFAFAQHHLEKIKTAADSLAAWATVDKREQESGRELTHSDESSAGGKSSKLTPEAVYLGDGRLCVFGESLALEGQDQMVLQALVELQAATKSQLELRSGVGDAVRILKRLVDKFPQLAPFITIPGKRGAGGYRTTIKPAVH